MFSTPVCTRKQTNGSSVIDQGFSTGSYNRHHTQSGRVVDPPPSPCPTLSASAEPIFKTDCANWLHAAKIWRHQKASSVVKGLMSKLYPITLCVSAWKSTHAMFTCPWGTYVTVPTNLQQNHQRLSSFEVGSWWHTQHSERHHVRYAAASEQTTFECLFSENQRESRLECNQTVTLQVLATLEMTCCRCNCSGRCRNFSCCQGCLP